MVLPFAYTLKLPHPQTYNYRSTSVSLPFHVWVFLVKPSTAVPDKDHIISLDYNSIPLTVLAPTVLHCRYIQKSLKKTNSIVPSPYLKILNKFTVYAKTVNSLPWHTKLPRSDANQHCQVVFTPTLPSYPRIQSKQNTCCNWDIPIVGTLYGLCRN